MNILNNKKISCAPKLYIIQQNKGNSINNCDFLKFIISITVVSVMARHATVCS